MDERLAALQADEAIRLAEVLLNYQPRYLSAYLRLVRALWLARRWEEGEMWGRRLLQADPTNALAWRAVARGVEERGNRKEAHAIWRRAFECDPYEPEIRAGLQRTSIQGENVLDLNLACLGVAYLRGQHWQRAAQIYRSLLEAEPRRIDFQLGLVMALWQSRAYPEAYQLADRLRRTHPHLLLAWVVIDDCGDYNDKALAHHPLQSMDADGDYRCHWWELADELHPQQLMVTVQEAQLIV
jgi:tetratricopeptide (TPR) repeat protein